jgi:hypothetical protein
MKTAPLFVLPVMIAQTYAFDVWGFHSGMSEDEAAAVGRRNNTEMRCK